jgi:hypothetical protein
MRTDIGGVEFGEVLNHNANISPRNNISGFLSKSNCLFEKHPITDKNERFMLDGELTVANSAFKILNLFPFNVRL